MGFTHCEIGASIVEAWKLPQSLCETCHHHHDPTQAERDHLTVALVGLADHLAYAGPDAPLADTPAWAVLTAHHPPAAQIDPNALAATCLHDLETPAAALA